MSPVAPHLDLKRVETMAPIPNWFGVGGRADRLVRPESIDELRTCLRMDANLRVLGDGANILVDDAGVPELVVALSRDPFTSITIDPQNARAVAGAGAKLPRLINDTTRAGLAGLEPLAGIPATVGGAVAMNAGGKFGEIAHAVRCVHALDRAGNALTLTRAQCALTYRASAIAARRLLVTAVEFDLSPQDPTSLRARLDEILHYKTSSQPPGRHSAGCCFKNPTLPHPLEGIADAGARVSAGLLIDRAGCKGLAVAAARVSDLHANFILTSSGCLARHVIELIDLVRSRVQDRFGVALEPEVDIWRRPTPLEEMAR